MPNNLPPREQCYDAEKLRATKGAVNAIALKNRLFERYDCEKPPKDWEDQPEWCAWFMNKPKVSRVLALAVIDVYDGNASATSKAIGLESHTVSKLAADPIFRQIIMARKGQDIGPQIADRAARQAFWTEVMMNDGADMGDRLKASELLGKSFADFTDKQILEGKVFTVTDVLKTLDARAEKVQPMLSHNERKALPGPETKKEETDDFLQ